MRSRTRFLAATAAVTLAALGFAAPAGAAVVCTFTAPAVTVTMDASESATIGRLADAIAVNGVACDTATISNTDTIAVTPTGVPTLIAIDLSAGPLGPGLTPEADGSEIEITLTLPSGTTPVRVIGSPGADRIVAGGGGINLNADEVTADADVTFTGTAAVTIDGGDGDDVLSLGGGAGAGTPIAGTLTGGLGDDDLAGGAPGSTFDGGDGVDLVDYSAATALSANLATGQVTYEAGGTDTLTAIEALIGSPEDDTFVGSAGNDDLTGGDGSDTIDLSGAAAGVTVDLVAGIALGEGDDTLAEIENVIGSPGDDTITGDGSANILAGGAGNDTIDGGAEADTLTGGDGEDTVSFASSGRGITLNLRRGTAEGDGDDTVEGFEHVIGSRKADTIDGDGGRNILDGSGGKDDISGGGGVDQVLGASGADRLFGEKGNDLLKGADGKDQLNGGKGKDRCKGGADPDSFVFCENFPT
ncbi:MAG: calcium-binding protein [Actinomycetota bacterium]